LLSTSPQLSTDSQFSTLQQLSTGHELQKESRVSTSSLPVAPPSFGSSLNMALFSRTDKAIAGKMQQLSTASQFSTDQWPSTSLQLSNEAEVLINKLAASSSGPSLHTPLFSRAEKAIADRIPLLRVEISLDIFLKTVLMMLHIIRNPQQRHNNHHDRCSFHIPGNHYKYSPRT
jgi:hypothetical protein